jgi:acetylornithine deacetylase/succinyl-diaminopimelate desuccinylase-like protein
MTTVPESARAPTSAAPPITAADARAILLAIAQRPRPAGGAEEAHARAYAGAALREAGFVVTESPFAYSALVGRWGTPIGGASSMAVLTGVAILGAVGRPAAALALLLAALAVGGWIGAWAARHGVLRAPALRRTGVNLVATRGGAIPQVWLMAHLDSKSQPVPIGLRAVGVMGTIVAWAGALALATTQSLTTSTGAPGLWPWVAALGLVAGVPVAASIVTAHSPGALDDASGVATVLLAAAHMPDDAGPLGVLLTSAEELGLAGGRAWAAQWRESGRAAGVVLNVDGVDDAGALTVMTGARAPAPATAALREAAHRAQAPLTVRRLVPGILVDAVALADAGWAAVTLSRGSWRTLARIHTPRDTVDRLDGRGIAEAATVLARAAGALASASPRGAASQDGAPLPPASGRP